MMKITLAVALLCAVPLGLTPQVGARIDDGIVTAAIERARAATGVPAISVIAVERNRTLYAHAFGLADLDNRTPATTGTRFYIASATKSFTGLAAAILAADGKLDLDAPLTKTLPLAHFRPPLDAARMSLRDLLTHRLGFENDGINYRTADSGEFDEALIWRLLEADSRPTSRSFSYDNLGYILSGYAIGKAGGGTWKSVVESRILAPLAMQATTVHPVADAATPYVFAGGRWMLAPKKREETMHAAGGMFASTDDLGRFLRAQLGVGELDGTQVLPTRAVREALSPQIGLRATFHRYQRYAYGLGWYHSDFDGELLLHDFGGFPGAQAHLSFMPERNLGIAVLTNTNGLFAHIVASYLYDVLLGKPEAQARLDADVKQLAGELASSDQDRRAEIDQAANELPSAVLTSSHRPSWYSGIYLSDALGTMAIEEARGQLIARFGVLSGPLTPVRGDAFLIELFPGRVEIGFFRGPASGANSLGWSGHEFTRK